MNRNMPVSPDGKWVVPHEGFDRGRAADSGANDGQAGGVLDFGAISRALFHWRWLIAGATIVGLVLGLIATMLITPMYRASVTIEVNPPTVQVTDSKNSPQTEAGGTLRIAIRFSKSAASPRSCCSLFPWRSLHPERALTLGQGMGQHRQGSQGRAHRIASVVELFS